MRKNKQFKIYALCKIVMIVDVYGEKGKRGRKKKIVEEPPATFAKDAKDAIDAIDTIDTIDRIDKKDRMEDDKYTHSLITKKEKHRMEKYGIIGYEPIVDIFKNIILTKNVPNLTIYGKSGTGKSYLVNWLLMKLFKNHIKERVLMMSLIDERGISTMREKIKAFSNILVKEDPNLPSVKIIVFDQAEYLSMDAQNALRRIIELSNNITRFIFITRNTRAIIDPILSRCLQLNLCSSAVERRKDDYSQFFPNLVKKDIYEVCNIYNNFGMEIAVLENMNLYNLKNEKILGDDKIKLLIDLFLDSKTTMRIFIEFIGENIRDILIIYSLHKIYRGLREKIIGDGCECIAKLSEIFLDFEVCGNTGSSENIFLLHLFCDIHSIIGGGNYRSPLTPPYPGVSPGPPKRAQKIK
jgi:hypothetical protein